MPFRAFRNYYPSVFRLGTLALRYRSGPAAQRFGHDMHHLLRASVDCGLPASAHPHRPENRLAACQNRHLPSHGFGDFSVDKQLFKLLGTLHAKWCYPIPRFGISNGQRELEPRQVKKRLVPVGAPNLLWRTIRHHCKCEPEAGLSDGEPFGRSFGASII